VRGDCAVDDVGYPRGVTGWILTGDVLDRRTVGEIQTKVIEQSGRNVVSRFFHAKDDKETIAGWKTELNRILRVFSDPPPPGKRHIRERQCCYGQ
jgi:hypothetical protein